MIKVNKSETLTVGELIDELLDFDPDLPVLFGYDYGDHWHTMVAQSIDSINEEAVKHSDYHNMNIVIDCDKEDPDGRPIAVVLS